MDVDSVGQRWVVRHRLPDGSATDVIGWVERLQAGAIELFLGPDRPNRWIALDTVIVARRAPAAAGGPDPLRVSAAELEQIALPGWVGEHEPLGEWTLRAAGGFTGRANSCLAVGDPGVDLPTAAERILAYAAAHGIPPWVQVVVGSTEERALHDLGWRPVYVTTTVLVAALAKLLGDTAPDPAVSVATALSDRWLAAYAQSRPNDADPQLLREILDGRPPRAFAGAGDDAGLFAIGRGHVHRQWLGLASVWVGPGQRGRGWGRRMMLALGHWGARQGARYAYLQVAEQNTVAISAYERWGFRRHHDYRYLTAVRDG